MMISILLALAFQTINSIERNTRNSIKDEDSEYIQFYKTVYDKI